MKKRGFCSTLGAMIDEASERNVGAKSGGGRMALLVLAVFIIVLLVGLGLFGLQMLARFDEVNRQLAGLSARADESMELSMQAIHRAGDAEAFARSAAAGRERALAETAEALGDAALAREEAEDAREDADVARQAAAQAETEARRIRQQAEAELTRLQDALGQIGETRRTALGVVMNLGSEYLKFEFDKAELQTGDRELLSRVAGILLTSREYTVSVNGHTDDVGSADYNQKLSERRAQAVRDYLVEAGLSPQILSVTGHGKERPLVTGTSDEARARNRRVELGIVNTRIRYGRDSQSN